MPQKIIINLIILIASFVSHGYGLLVIQQMNRYSRRNLEHGEYQCFNWLQLNMSNYCSVNWSWECLLLQLWTIFSVCILFLFCFVLLLFYGGSGFSPCFCMCSWPSVFSFMFAFVCVLLLFYGGSGFDFGFVYVIVQALLFLYFILVFVL